MNKKIKTGAVRISTEATARKTTKKRKSVENVNCKRWITKQKSNGLNLTKKSTVGSLFINHSQFSNIATTHRKTKTLKNHHRCNQEHRERAKSVYV